MSKNKLTIEEFLKIKKLASLVQWNWKGGD